MENNNEYSTTSDRSNSSKRRRVNYNDGDGDNNTTAAMVTAIINGLEFTCSVCKDVHIASVRRHCGHHICMTCHASMISLTPLVNVLMGPPTTFVTMRDVRGKPERIDIQRSKCPLCDETTDPFRFNLAASCPLSGEIVSRALMYDLIHGPDSHRELPGIHGLNSTNTDVLMNCPNLGCTREQMSSREAYTHATTCARHRFSCPFDDCEDGYFTLDINLPPLIHPTYIDDQSEERLDYIDESIASSEAAHSALKAEYHRRWIQHVETECAHHTGVVINGTLKGCLLRECHHDGVDVDGGENENTTGDGPGPSHTHHTTATEAAALQTQCFILIQKMAEILDFPIDELTTSNYLEIRDKLLALNDTDTDTDTDTDAAAA